MKTISSLLIISLFPVFYQSPYQARMYLVSLNPPNSRGHNSEKHRNRSGIIRRFPVGMDKVIFGNVTGADVWRGCGLGRGDVKI
jgi:hypothetical protein